MSPSLGSGSPLDSRYHKLGAITAFLKWLFVTSESAGIGSMFHKVFQFTPKQLMMIETIEWLRAQLVGNEQSEAAASKVE
jgi:hypothetical protein